MCSLLGAIGLHYAYLRLGLGYPTSKVLNAIPLTLCICIIYEDDILSRVRVAKQSACIALYYRNTTWNVVERTAYI